MVKGIRVHEVGGPQVMKYEEFELPKPGPGEVRVVHEAIGVNYIDTYFRTGLYPAPPPFTIGNEAAGVVSEVGKKVTGFKVGDRVAYVAGMRAYADEANVPAEVVVKLPKAISAETAAGMMLKGMTAEYLVRRTYKVREGDTVLVHAAAGGVGQILCQWAKALGATVIGTVGTEDKAQLARRLGCDHVIFYRTEDVAARVKAITEGKGVPVAYDSVGKDTFEGTLASLARRGLFVSFGNASGPVPAFEPLRLSRAGSLFFTRPTLFDYVATPEELDDSAGALFAMIGSGKLRIEIGQRFRLGEARKAHEALEGRQTIGASVLIP